MRLASSMPLSRFSTSVAKGVTLSLILLLTAQYSVTPGMSQQEPAEAAPAALKNVGKDVANKVPSDDELRAGFAHPPASARPRVWWHWMGGNISLEGLRRDLSWMHDIGLGGYQLFDAARSTPTIVEKRLAFMTPAWQDALREATTIATGYGMEQGIAASPGWSETGGPWVPPADGMKKYVWSETALEGGKRFQGKLRSAPTQTGPFQDRAVEPNQFSTKAETDSQFYRDAAVIAYRQQDTEFGSTVRPIVTASDNDIQGARLTDGLYAEYAGLAVPAVGEQAFIRYDYSRAVTVRAVTISTFNPNRLIAWLYRLSAPEIRLEASDDGMAWRKIADLPAGATAAATVMIPQTTSRYFRFVFRRPPPAPVPDWAVGVDPVSYGYREPTPEKRYLIAELQLHGAPRVDGLQQKAAFVLDGGTAPIQGGDQAGDGAILAADVIDLTGKLKTDGTLDWTPPPGRWVVVRLGYSLIGKTNHPASPEATGLEVDKLNGDAVRRYIETYLDMYTTAVGTDLIGKRGIEYLVNDSWESGSQNWTDDMPKQFRTRRGYDMIPWLPVLTGQIVVSRAKSDAFLWDFRKTIGELIAERHYGTLQTVLRERGMGQYVESHEGGRAFTGDGMQVKKLSQVPMSAMWARPPSGPLAASYYNADARESASVAHIYGQNIAAAESFTANTFAWSWHPGTLKNTADQEFLNGINRIFIHSSVHQPLEGTGPGLTLGPFGQWFNRNETWANEAKPWISYLARSSYLLQQGRFVADIAHFYGEDTNLTSIYSRKPPEFPTGFGYDFVDADTVANALAVAKDGTIETPGGMRYHVLELGKGTREMSLPTLRAIHRLVTNGGSIAGSKPERSPSNADDPREFSALADTLFGVTAGLRKVGLGRVFSGQTASEALGNLGVQPDVDWRDLGNAGLAFVHRTLGDRDIYYISNRTEGVIDAAPIFRVNDRAPELWRPETGQINELPFRKIGDRMQVPLTLKSGDAVFVTFLKLAKQERRIIPVEVVRPLAQLAGPWTVSFLDGRGAPSNMKIADLASWSLNDNPAIRYYSGSAVYSRALEIPSSWLRAGRRIELDLGAVANMATVTVNGKLLGSVWHSPFRLDITSALNDGRNSLSISVTNSWVNRLIGDQQPNATKWTDTTFKPYTADSKLELSGLLGPVKILAVDAK